MATKDVEILINGVGSQIKNAASEATMQELLKAVKHLEKQSGGGGGAAGAAGQAMGAAKMAGKLGPMAAAIEMSIEALTGLAKMLGGTAASIKTFGKMISDGKSSFSDYANVVNENLIKNIPFVGETLGQLGEVVVAVFKIMEGWNEELKKSAKVGATFGNSLIELRYTAAQARMDVGDFVSVIMKNSQQFASYGGTVQEGATQFASGMKNLMGSNSQVKGQLLNMGYTTNDVADIFARWMVTNTRGRKIQGGFDDELNRSFLAYIKNLDALSKLSGQSTETLDKMAEVASQDVAYQKARAKLSIEEQTKLDMRLKEVVAMYGKDGAELHKAMFLGVEPISQSANMLRTMFPKLWENEKRIMADVKDPRITAEQFTIDQTERLVDDIENAKQFAKNSDQFITAVAQSGDQAGLMGDGIKTMLERLAKYGNVNDLTRAQIKEIVLAAKKEQKQVDGITELLDTFSLMTKDIREGFMSVILPELDKAGAQMKQLKIPEMMEKFGTYLGELSGQALPYLKEFLTNLTSEDGQAAIKNQLSALVALMSVEIRRVVKKTIMPEVLYDTFSKEEDNKREAAAKQDLKVANIAAGRKEGAKEGTAGSGTQTAQVDEGSRDVRLQSGEKTTQLAQQGWQLGDLFGGAKAKDVQQFKGGTLTYGGAGYSETGFDAMATPEQRITQSVKAQGFIFDDITPVKSPVTGTILSAGNGRVEIYDPKAGEGGVTTVISNLDPSSEAVFKGLVGKDVERGALIGYTKSGKTAEANKSWLNGEFTDAQAREKARTLFQMYSGKGTSGFEMDPTQFRQKFSTGTLGVLGKLFGDFGTGTPVELHGNEAVVTPKQLENIVKSKDQIALVEIVASLNTSVTAIIANTREELKIERDRINAQGKITLPDRA
jgi:hypothetical protein